MIAASLGFIVLVLLFITYALLFIYKSVLKGELSLYNHPRFPLLVTERIYKPIDLFQEFEIYKEEKEFSDQIIKNRVLDFGRQALNLECVEIQSSETQKGERYTLKMIVYKPEIKIIQ